LTEAGWVGEEALAIAFYGELSVGLRRSRLEPGGGSEAVAFGHPTMPVGDGFVCRFIAVDG
jgi:hypothetical protein